MPSSSRSKITVVCPVFNEEKTVPLFYQRLAPVLETQKDDDWEILFVNNRSTDGTLDAIHALREKDPRVQVLTLSRNFGYQASITAGMTHASGDASVNIDVDCEDPPEMIPAFVERWKAGADIAYGIRDKRQEFVVMHLARKLFYRGIKQIADHEIVLDMAEFFLVDKRVRDHVLATRSTFPFVRGQVGYVGFKREGIKYQRQTRIIGETHYNLLGAIRFGMAGILSSSTSPLRALAYFGALTFATDAVFALIFLFGLVHQGLDVLLRLGVALTLLNLGWLAFAAGVLGIYLARVDKDTIAFPLFVADSKLSTIPVKRHGA